MDQTASTRSGQSSLDEDTVIIIHVCDEARKLNRDFKCGKQMLLEGMKYFRSYLSESQCTDIDISVHCDVEIFQWLMNYMKAPVAEQRPKIDTRNVVSILISSDFLQMDELAQECLQFFCSHAQEIIKSPVDLSCLNETLLSHLTALFTLDQLEQLSDRRDKLLGKIYMRKLETLLCQEENNLYQCARCGVVFCHRHQNHLICVHATPMVEFHGTITAKHTPNLAWDVNQYLLSLKARQMDWRSIFWRVWGIYQSLECTSCGANFPVNQMDHCRFHPQTASQSNASVHPCCGAGMHQFDPLRPTSSGCKARRHAVQSSDAATSNVLKQTLLRSDLILSPFPTSTGSEQPSWKATLAFQDLSCDCSSHWLSVDPGYGYENGDDWDLDYALFLRQQSSKGHEEDEEDEPEEDPVGTSAHSRLLVSRAGSNSKGKSKRSQSRPGTRQVHPLKSSKSRSWKIDALRDNDRKRMSTLTSVLLARRNSTKPRQPVRHQTKKHRKKTRR